VEIRKEEQHLAPGPGIRAFGRRVGRVLQRPAGRGEVALRQVQHRARDVEARANGRGSVLAPRAAQVGPRIRQAARQREQRRAERERFHDAVPGRHPPRGLHRLVLRPKRVVQTARVAMDLRLALQRSRERRVARAAIEGDRLAHGGVRLVPRLVAGRDDGQGLERAGAREVEGGALPRLDDLQACGCRRARLPQREATRDAQPAQQVRIARGPSQRPQDGGQGVLGASEREQPIASLERAQGGPFAARPHRCA
jgi:hypothetical protein